MMANSQQATRLSTSARLGKVSPELAFATTFLYGRSLHLSADKALQLDAEFGAFEFASADLEIGLRCAGHVFRLQIAHGTDLLGERWLLTEQMPAAYLRALVLTGAGDLLDGLALCLGQPVELVSAKMGGRTWGTDAAVGVQLVLRRGTSRAVSRCQVMIQADHASAWDALCAAAQPRLVSTGAPPSGSVEVNILVEPVHLDMTELHGLCAGDLLLLNSVNEREQGLSVGLSVSGPTFHTAHALLRGRRIHLVAPRAHAPSAPLSHSWRSPMNANAQPKKQGDPSPASAASATQKVELGNMQVEVQVQVGRMLMPLTVLQNLAEGQVFDTHQSIDGNTVGLWAGGQCFARGQLVALGDRVGVRLVSVQPQRMPATTALAQEADLLTSRD